MGTQLASLIEDRRSAQPAASLHQDRAPERFQKFTLRDPVKPDR